MRLKVKGIVDKVEKVKPQGRVFRQLVILEQPERRDDFDRVVQRAQYFPIIIISAKESDSRFLNNSDLKTVRTADASLIGDRWAGANGFQYALKLMLQEWT